MNELENKIRKLQSDKLEVQNKFKEYVTDKTIALSERVHFWESYATQILPIGNWLSSAPTALRKSLERRDRYSLVTFDDLVEDIIPESIWEDSPQFETTGQAIDYITDVHPEIRDMFEEVLASNYSGTHIDW